MQIPWSNMTAELTHHHQWTEVGQVASTCIHLWQKLGVCLSQKETSANSGICCWKCIIAHFLKCQHLSSYILTLPSSPSQAVSGDIMLLLLFNLVSAPPSVYESIISFELSIPDVAVIRISAEDLCLLWRNLKGFWTLTYLASLQPSSFVKKDCAYVIVGFWVLGVYFETSGTFCWKCITAHFKKIMFKLVRVSASIISLPTGKTARSHIYINRL